MKNKIQTSDLLILQKLFFATAEQILLFEPQRNTSPNISSKIQLFSTKNDLQKAGETSTLSYLIINCSKENLEDFLKQKNCLGIIDLAHTKAPAHNRYYYLNNPDQSMRWIFPAQSKSPAFLELYNSSGPKAQLFKWLSKGLHFFSGIPALANGSFSVISRSGISISPHFGDLPFDDFAIFTGTVGENRKAIVALCERKQCSSFVKIPLGEAAQELVDWEFRQLKKIQSLPLKQLRAPWVKKLASGVAVENIRPPRFEKDSRFHPLHLQALAELYQQSATLVKWEDLSLIKPILSGLLFFRKNQKPNNGLSFTPLQALQKYCTDFFYQLEESKTIAVAFGHGDFTPWNMYRTETQLRVYDWEMSREDLPLFFDLFHYCFQKGILIERKSWAAIEQEIQSIMEWPESRALIQQFQIDWQAHLSLYLLYIVCYYLPKYTTQAPLHQQVHWLVDTWLAAWQTREIVASPTFHLHKP